MSKWRYIGAEPVFVGYGMPTAQRLNPDDAFTVVDGADASYACQTDLYAPEDQGSQVAVDAHLAQFAPPAPEPATEPEPAVKEPPYKTPKSTGASKPSTQSEPVADEAEHDEEVSV